MPSHCPQVSKDMQKGTSSVPRRCTPGEDGHSRGTPGLALPAQALVGSQPCAGATQGCHAASRQRRCRRACLLAAAPVEQAQQAQASSNGKPAAAGPSGQQQDPNAVLVTEERMPQSHIRLTVTVPPALVRKSYDKGLKQLRSKTEVPGFRAGKKARSKPPESPCARPHAARNAVVHYLVCMREAHGPACMAVCGARRNGMQ